MFANLVSPNCLEPPDVTRYIMSSSKEGIELLYE